MIERLIPSETPAVLLTATQTPPSQQPFDVAVVVPTLLRPSLLRAVRSVFAQDFDGRIQLLIGIDIAEGERNAIETLRAECPAHVALLVLDPGYSTSVRHGGLHANRFSGALRTILTYLAHSRFVAYLDDDNWFAPDHLASLKRAIDGVDYAYAQRWFVGPDDDTPLCVDDWESVGPGAGVYREQFGGFIDPSSLMIDKLACPDVAPLWAMSPFADGSGEDRLVFEALRERRRGAATGQATSFYRMHARDAMHLQRLQAMRERGITLPGAAGAGIRPLALAAAGFGLTAAAGAEETRRSGFGVDTFLDTVVGQLKPREVVVLGDIALAEAAASRALAAGLETFTLVADVDGPVPAVPADLAPRLAMLPESAGDPFAWLGSAGIAVDLVLVAGATRATGPAFETAWRVARVGGLILIDAAAAPEPILQEIAARLGATLHAAVTPERARWLVQKER